MKRLLSSGKRIKHVLFLLLTPVIFLAACVDDNNGTRAEEYVNVGDQVPTFTVGDSEAVTGDEGFESPGVFIEKKSLLVFFVTSCPDCQRELPFVQYAREQLPDLQVIAIGREETSDRVTAFWAENELDMPVYLDPNRTIFNLFASMTVPRIYLIDEDTKVVWKGIEKLGYGNFTVSGGQRFISLIKKQLNI